MPRQARLRKVGGSTMLAIPKGMLEQLDMAPDATVDLSIERGRLVVNPHRRRRYSLEQLLSECDPKARRPVEHRAWLDTRPVGRELI